MSLQRQRTRCCEVSRASGSQMGRSVGIAHTQHICSHTSALEGAWSRPWWPCSHVPTQLRCGPVPQQHQALGQGVGTSHWPLRHLVTGTAATKQVFGAQLSCEHPRKDSLCLLQNHITTGVCCSSGAREGAHSPHLTSFKHAPAWRALPVLGAPFCRYLL